MSKHGSCDRGPSKSYSLFAIKDYIISYQKATTEQQQPHMTKLHISNDFKVLVREIQIQVDPASFKGVIRSAQSIFYKCILFLMIRDYVNPGDIWYS